jgi:hypothetical protein
VIGAALALLGSALVIRFLAWMCKPVQFHDLTRPGSYLDQVTRERDNSLALAGYAARMEARGLAPVRRVVCRPDPAQIADWENDGGAIA